jgi:hypothetical protein
MKAFLERWGMGESISRHLTAFMKALLFMRERERERDSYYKDR